MNSSTLKLTAIWLVLLTLTLLSTFLAEGAQPRNSLAITIFVCAIVSLKGIFVIEQLMNLKTAKPIIRWMMLAYFLVLPITISLFVAFPEYLAELTTF